MTRLRAAVPLLVLTAGIATVPAVSEPAAASAVSCQTAQRVDGPFRSVAKPGDLLPGPLTAHAVEPADPRTVYLADPTRVAVSQDAGCTWELLLEVPAAPASAIRSLTVPDTAEPTGRLLVAVSAEGAADGAFASSTVLWVRSGPGLPFRQSTPLPGRVDPAVSPGDPDVVYAATNDVLLPGTAPARSVDGGLTFTPATGVRQTTAPSGPTVDSGPRLAAVDPDDRDTLLVGSSSVQRSEDGGGSWTEEIDQRGIGYAHALVVHPAGGDAAGQAVVAATEASNSGLQTDSARLWSLPRDEEPEALPVGPPLVGIPESLAVGRTAQEVVLTATSLRAGFNDGYDGPGALFLLDAPRGTWVDVADRRGHPLIGAQIDRTADPAVHLRSSALSEPAGADEYVVYSPPARGRVVPPTVDDGTGAGAQEVPPPAFPSAPRACPDAQVFTAPETRRSAARLTPAATDVTAGDGGRADHQVVLDLVGDASALDLHVLLDTSDSMGPAAAGVVCGLEELVTGLAADGVDLRVGLSTFFDQGPGQRYERVVDLAPVGAAVQRALRSVVPRGGVETHRTALLQTVTGRGLVVDGVQHVAPGQAASFRRDALKVVLHVTDEPWQATTPGEPSPLEVTAALRQAGVRHVGLQVQQRRPEEATRAGGDRLTGIGANAQLRAQLDQFSSGSGALAPAGGVDCDADGTADLREGEPLVCVGVSDGGVVPLGAAVRALVSALEVRGPVTLRAESPAGVTSEVGARFDDVDLRAPGRFAFPLALECGAATGQLPVSVTAVAGAVDVASAAVLLRCPPDPPVLANAPQTDPASTVTAAEPPSQAGPAAAPPAAPPPVQVPAPAPAAAPAPGTAGAGAGAAAGAASAAGSGAGAAATGGQGAAGLAAAPSRGRTAPARALVGGGEFPLAAVPLAGGLLSTAALTTHLLATRRRPSALVTARTKDRS